MKIVKKTQTTIFQNNIHCAVTEFPLGDADLSGAVIQITGRYPENELIVNTTCKEIAYVIEGSGAIVSNNVTTKVEKGDMMLIMPGDTYYWEGNLTLFEANTPAWHPEQHLRVER